MGCFYDACLLCWGLGRRIRSVFVVKFLPFVAAKAVKIVL